MNYILKYVIKSKYLNHVKVYYKEFNSYNEIYEFIEENEIRSCDYDIYGKVIL